MTAERNGKRRSESPNFNALALRPRNIVMVESYVFVVS
jgi:hypothetical protein